jgi:hypothetical protein
MAKKKKKIVQPINEVEIVNRRTKKVRKVLIEERKKYEKFIQIKKKSSFITMN